MRAFLLSATLIACSQPPTLTAVEPNRALPGEAVEIRGERLAAPVVVRLEAEGRDAIELEPSAVSPERIALTLPEGAAAGTYDVVVVSGRATVRAPGGFLVLAPPADLPCGQLYRANTKVSALAGEVVIDRFYRGGERETLRAKLAEIASIEHARVPGPDGGPCSVITLIKADGERLRFADDDKLDLANRAQKLAQEIGRPLLAAE
jgi:hypothetical protein